jgi:haloacetate dehalogenase
VTKGAVLDIAPTLTMYDQTPKEFATKYAWWFLQIQPAPMPEHLISLDPGYYLRDHLAVQGKTPGAVTPEAMAEYIRCMRGRRWKSPSRVRSPDRWCLPHPRAPIF